MDQSQVRDLLDQATINPGQIFFLMFGGPEKFDFWLSRIADEAVDPRRTQAPNLPAGLVPPQFADLMHRPLEVVDFLLGNLERLGVWQYEVRTEGQECLVIDQISAHIIETRPASPDALEQLETKYARKV